jgi:hypothetical protein
MTFPRPAAFPGGRVLAGWWKQLAAWRPRTLWIGSLLLERVEVLCRLRQTEPLPPLEGILLEALDPVTARPGAALDQALGLGPNLLERLLARLELRNVVRNISPGWLLTPAGISARQHGCLPGSRSERRAFWFLADPDQLNSPAFVVPTSFGGLHAIDDIPVSHCSLQELNQSVNQDGAWKRRRGFPEDVEAILTPETPSSGQGAWERLVVVYPYSLQAALITFTQANGTPGLAVFPYQEHGWSLATRPVIELAAGWEEIFPHLPIEPSEEVIAGAWRRWLAQRGQAQAAELYRLERHAETIGVLPRSDGGEILGGPRGDLARGEAWLVLHEGTLRQVTRLEPEAVARPVR